MFTLRQGEQSVQEQSAGLRALLDELDVYQPLTVDITKLCQYREELAVAVYLSRSQFTVTDTVHRYKAKF